MALFSLTVTSGDVAATLTDYPAYVDLAQMPAAFWSNVTPNAQTHSLDLETGSSQYASIADASQTGLDLSGDNTIEFWVKPESLPGSGAIWGMITKDDLASQRSYAVDLYNNAGSQKIRMFMSSNAGGTNYVEVTFTHTLITGIWQHVTISTDISNAAATRSTLYINAQSQGNGSAATGGTGASSIANTTSAFTIGRYGTSAATFDGLIKDVRVFNDIRTAAEIRADMQVQTVSDANLVGEWNFNNAYTDSSGNSNTLTASGSPVFSTDVPFTNAGRDIRMYSDEAATTRLACEIVSCDISGETGEVHVKIPSLTTSTVIYLEVDEDGLSGQVRSTDTYGSEAVWTEYQAVYHNQTTGGVDATGNGYTLTETSASYTPGQMGGALDIGTNAQIRRLSANSNLGVGAEDAFTTSFIWKQATDDASGTPIPFRFVSNTTTNYKGFQMQYESTPQVRIFAENSLIVGGALGTGINHFFITRASGAAGTITYYKNAASQGTVAQGANNFNSTGEISIGANSGGNGGNGWIDEVRVTNQVLSTDWGTTEYNNQSDVAGFWTIAEVGTANTTNFFAMM